MGAPKNTTTTNTSEPPEYLQPFLTNAAQQATNQFQKGDKQYYPGSTLAGQSFQTNQTMADTYDRATRGSGAVDAGQNFIQQGLSGSAQPAYNANSNLFGSASNPFASGANPYGSVNNPYMDAQFQRAALSTQNQLASEFNRAGRNVGASEPIRAQQLNDLASSMYGGAYENERNRGLSYGQQQLGIGATGYENERARMANEQGQNQSINANAAENAAQRQQGLLGYGIPYANQDYTDLQQRASVGTAMDQRAQQEVNADVDRYNYGQNAAGNSLDEYIRRLTGFAGTGGVQTQVTPNQGNGLGSALGGAMSGASLGGMFGPWGSLIGGGAGLLGGIFG